MNNPPCRIGYVKTLIQRGAARLLTVFVFTLGSFHGMADSAPPEELQTADQIRRLAPLQADLHYPVRLRGVVTFFDDRIPTRSFRFIQDETAGIYFYVDGSTNNPVLRPGQLIELKGETGAGSFAPVVTSHRVRILGEGELPPAKPVSSEDLASGQEDSQFVETRGIVRAVWKDESSGYFFIMLATGQGGIIAQARQLPVAKAEELVDSLVRVKGVCMSRFNSQRQLFDIGLLVPLPEDLTVDQPSPVSSQSLPAQPIKNLLQFAWGGSYGHRVKIAGTVTLHFGYRLYIQDDTEGVCVETRQAGEVRLGDHVEVLGFPAKGEYTPVLQNGVLRRLTNGPDLKPEKITPDEALSGSHDCRLVQIEATLLDRVQHSKEPFLVLQANGFVFHAQLTPSGQRAFLGNLQNGSKVSVTGVCVIDNLGEEWHSGPDWRAGSFRLFLRSPEDVVVVKSPPWWNLQKLLWAIGLLCAIIMAAFGWVLLLRRRVHQQTQIIEEKFHAEATLKERYLDLFENANDMVFTHDLSGRMTSINKAGERLLHRERSEILTRNLIDLLAEEERSAASEWLRKVTLGEETSAVDWDFLNAAGQKLKLEVSSRLVDQTGRSTEIEGIARDVTARKRMEKEILEISNREQQRLGHDLHDGVCQQLAAIAYRAHILARQLKDKDTEISTEANHISELINDSLVQTRSVARGLFPVRLEEDGLAAAVEELTINAGKLYNVQCDYSASGTLPNLHNGVAMHLHFIAQEAILNAAKHSRASAISVVLQKEKGDLMMSVNDNGVGFQAADQQGTGMGIGIMQYRAKAIGAALELRTRPGAGTQICCRYHLPPDENSNLK